MQGQGLRRVERAGAAGLAEAGGMQGGDGWRGQIEQGLENQESLNTVRDMDYLVQRVR